MRTPSHPIYWEPDVKIALFGRMIAPYVAVTALAVTAGCTTWDLQDLRKATPPEDPFQRALATHYLNFAEEEAVLHDWVDSQYFAQKGLRVIYGQKVEPERPGDWDIAPDMQQQAAAGRDALMQALSLPVAQARPIEAANAIFGFDCWLEQMEENWQADDIEACRTLFETNLKLLGEPEVVEDLPPPPPAPVEEAPREPAVVTQSFVVFFPFDSSVITAEAKVTVKEIATSLKSTPSYDVILSGHADRAGKNPYNEALALRRAEAVKAALVAEGIQEESISIFSFGEQEPVVKTNDGVAEPRNRRVEIYLAE
jgi:OOP family OmpA-OmpF porin